MTEARRRGIHPTWREGVSWMLIDASGAVVMNGGIRDLAGQLDLVS
jgi:hypothetical protein